MDSYFVAIASAFWLGILTSISPCPLATNIAAISFIGNKVGRPGYVVTAGTLYTVGRSVAYIAIGIILVSSLLSSSETNEVTSTTLSPRRPAASVDEPHNAG